MGVFQSRPAVPKTLNISCTLTVPSVQKPLPPPPPKPEPTLEEFKKQMTS